MTSVSELSVPLYLILNDEFKEKNKSDVTKNGKFESREKKLVGYPLEV